MPSEQRPLVHLICNAHLDPVWMWAWEEGLREAISTFWTAVHLLEEFPEFVFNHNESLLYEWVEDYDPFLFERIRQLVAAGRWNITGGWYLQPDVNLPGGETLARVILEGRRYFQEKFGVQPPVAYNFDSFGHPCSLPQLLSRSGFDFYIHCRPLDTQMSLPAALYRWRSADGSEVMALRPDTGWYGTPHPGQPQEQARKGIELARQSGKDTLVTWGLGNHGGGATRQDLLAFRALIDEMQHADVEVRHSTPEAYLGRMKPYREELPVYEGELQRTLMGTYTSVAPIKRQMREGESLLASAERWAAIAWWHRLMDYPAETLRAAWKRLMFNSFHDVLCGSLLEGAIAGVEDMYGYAHDVARRILVKAQHAVLPRVKPIPETISLYVLNPHSFPVKAPVGCYFLSAYAPPPQKKPFSLYDDRQVPVIYQDKGGESVILEEGTWQPFVGFVAEMPPLMARRYEIRFETPVLPAGLPLDVVEDDGGIRIENTNWVAQFSRKTAALVSLMEKSSGKNILQAPAQLIAMHDVSHAWGGENNAIYNVPFQALTALSLAEVGVFNGMEGQEGPALRIYAQGAVWVTVECLVGWQHTRAALRYTFYAGLPYVDVAVRLYMQARRKMIKFVFPFDLPHVQAHCEVPYGVAVRPADATEYPYARWIQLSTPALSVGIANNGQNGFDVSENGVLGLSLSRGGVHCSWSETDIPTDKSYTWMDQGQIDTRFRLLAGDDGSAMNRHLVHAALELNQPLERFFTYYPPSLPETAPEKALSFLQIEPATVVLSALKKADHDEALIVRLHETAGVNTTAQIQIEEGAAQRYAFLPYEIKTLKIKRGAAGLIWQVCNLLEEVLD